MKILFVHDFPVIKYENKYYSTGFPYEIWKRYLKIFDELLICSRVKNEEYINGQKESSGAMVEFNPIKNYKNILSLFKNKKKIISDISKAIDKVDGVLIRVPSVLGFIAAKLCIKKNKPYMVEVVGAAYEAYRYHGSISGKILALPMELVQKEVVKNAEVSIFVTNSFLQNKYPSNGKEYGGITDVVKFNDGNSSKINFNGKTIKIGIIGSTYTRYKGHKEALKAMKILINSGFKIELQLVGQGLSDKVEKDIRKYNLVNNVKFLGEIYDRNLLNRWFTDIDIYIQPSMTEGLCRSLIESVCLNKVTFASDVGGNTDIISKEYTFRQKNYKKLADLLKEAIINPDFRKNNRKRNKELVSELKINKVDYRREEALNNFKYIVEEKSE
ncbi:glycosyltransferase family 4 protein [Staphylococcus saprophyticus]